VQKVQRTFIYTLSHHNVKIINNISDPQLIEIRQRLFLGAERTNHGGEDGGGGEERAREPLLHPDGDGERGDGGRVRGRHPAGPDQLLRVPPVLLVPALTRGGGRSRQVELRSARRPGRAGRGGRAGVPGGEDLDGLRDGEGEHRGDERAVGEHGQVGERGRARRRRRRRGGGDGVHGSRPALELWKVRVGLGLARRGPAGSPTASAPPPLVPFRFWLVCRAGAGGFPFVAVDARHGSRICYAYPTIRPSADPVKMHPGRRDGGPFMTWSEGVDSIYVLLKRLPRITNNTILTFEKSSNFKFN